MRSAVYRWHYLYAFHHVGEGWVGYFRGLTPVSYAREADRVDARTFASVRRQLELRVGADVDR